jgi:hypothetical protein
VTATQLPEVGFHRHAVERYAERVRPACSFAATLAELRAVVDCAGVVASIPPDWAPWDGATAAYLLIGEDIVFPLRRTPEGALMATTCLIRAWMPPTVRAARRARRRRRRER